MYLQASLCELCVLDIRLGYFTSQPLSHGSNSVFLPHYVFRRLFPWAWDKHCFSRKKTSCLYNCNI